MSEAAPEPPAVGNWIVGRNGRPIGRVESVFVDYVLVRTRSLLPVDLYIPRPALAIRGGRVTVEADSREAYRRWHRPLKSAPHD
ncbi:MAG: hypothetical protein M3406_06155 [Chloroflexota bacterium]|nr:hypothetical protein [Chloroflexota bacterium]